MKTSQFTLAVLFLAMNVYQGLMVVVLDLLALVNTIIQHEVSLSHLGITLGVDRAALKSLHSLLSGRYQK